MHLRHFSDCLSPGCLPAWSSTVHFGIYPSQTFWPLKLPNFKDLVQQRPGCSSGDILSMLGLMQVRPVRAVMSECRDMGFGAEQAKWPVSLLAVLSRCLGASAEGWGERNGSCNLFCPQRYNDTSHGYAPRSEDSFSLWTLGDAQIMPSVQGYLPAFSPGVGHPPLVSNPANSTGPEPHWWQKLVKINPYYLPSQ